MKRIAILMALVGAAAGCQGNAPSPQAGTSSADADRRYMQQVADRDQDMIALATAAEAKASEEHFRTMARNCIAKQQADSRQIQDWLAAWYGTAYMPRETAEGRRMLDHLRALSGKDFDREYLSDMIHEYQVNVDAGRPIAESSSRAQLRTLAQQVIKEQSHQVSHLQEHLAEVNRGPDHDVLGGEDANDHDLH